MGGPRVEACSRRRRGRGQCTSRRPTFSFEKRPHQGPHCTDSSKVIASLGERNEVAHDDLDHGEDGAAADALDAAAADRHGDVLRGGRDGASEGEEEDAADHDGAAAEDGGEAAGCRCKREGSARGSARAGRGRGRRRGRTPRDECSRGKGVGAADPGRLGRLELGGD